MKGKTQDIDSLFDNATVLNTWYRWLGIVALSCIAFLVAAASSTSGAALVGTGMYAVIGLVAVGCVWQSFREARFLDQQLRLASEQLTILESVNSLQDFFNTAKHSLFRRHIENLHIMASHHAEFSQDALIEILHERLMARNQVVELFSSILITLGLIGTIVGLIFMMNGLTIVMQDSGASGHLLKELTSEGGPLSGLGVAFYTTLLGATLGGVLLRILTSVVDASIGRYIAHVAELTEVHVLPYMRRTLAQTGTI